MRGLAIVFFLVGCAHKPAAEIETPRAPIMSMPVVAPVPVEVHPAGWCEADRDCSQGMTCVRHQCVVATSTPIVCEPQPVHFNYDSSVIADSERGIVEHDVECLRTSNVKVTVAGSCDSRGTEEYNMALGDQRARSLARQLVMRGISSKRIHTISYGEGQPVCSEENEACWSKNRRAELK